MTNTQQVNTSLNAGVAPPVPQPGNSTTGGSGSGPPSQQVKQVVAPAGTSSLGIFVMAGLNCVYTPLVSGKVNIRISGIAFNNSAGDGVRLQAVYGVSPSLPPLNGAVASGTRFGPSTWTTMQSTAALQGQTFVIEDTVTGFALNTYFWVDLQFCANTGGSANLQNITIEIMEVS